MVADQKGASRTWSNSKYVGSVRGNHRQAGEVPAGHDFPVRTTHILVEYRRSGDQLESPERIERYYGTERTPYVNLSA